MSLLIGQLPFDDTASQLEGLGLKINGVEDLREDSGFILTCRIRQFS